MVSHRILSEFQRTCEVATIFGDHTAYKQTTNTSADMRQHELNIEHLVKQGYDIVAESPYDVVSRIENGALRVYIGQLNINQAGDVRAALELLSTGDYCNIIHIAKVIANRLNEQLLSCKDRISEIIFHGFSLGGAIALELMYSCEAILNGVRRFNKDMKFFAYAIAPPRTGKRHSVIDNTYALINYADPVHHTDAIGEFCKHYEAINIYKVNSNNIDKVSNIGLWFNSGATGKWLNKGSINIKVHDPANYLKAIKNAMYTK